jgi:hypothetical protein
LVGFSDVIQSWPKISGGQNGQRGLGESCHSIIISEKGNAMQPCATS